MVSNLTKFHFRSFSTPKVAEACALLRAAVEYWLAKPEAHDTKLPAVLRLAMAFAAKQRDWELSALVHRTYLEQCDGSSQQVPERNFS